MLSGLMLAAVVLTATSCAQTPAQLPQAPEPQPDAQFVADHTDTKSTVVDVVVQDSSGHAVHGLTSRNFRLTEDGTPQTLLSVEEHSAIPIARQFPAQPKLPPGTFTDYTPVASGALNILLIDALNTPAEDQGFLRNQLQQYVEHTSPGTRIAIFGLANHLIVLQGFTSDPAILKSVMQHKLIPRVPLPSDRTGDVAAQPKDTPALLSATYLAANLQEFRAETHAMETELRAQYTLDAFNTLGHYLDAFPGRKNLIWFSGSFPANVLPDPSIQRAIDVTQVDTQELSRTADLLTHAQVAVYPIDVNGMMMRSRFNASDVDNGEGNSEPAGAWPGYETSDKRTKAPSSEQQKRDRLASATASDTGGEVFADAEDLAEAVADVTAAGADDYSLSYRPTDTEEDGAYRAIRVSLTGAEAGLGLKLFYRSGYYAAGTAPADRTSEATPLGQDEPFQNALAAAYAQAAMSRGAPMPQNLIMKVRVLPSSNSTENSLAPDNSLDASVPANGPFRRYDLDYAALAKELTLKLAPDGRRTGQMEFLVYVFDTYGRLLNATGKTVSFDVDSATYGRLMQSAIECHLEISAPSAVATFIRAGVRDVTSNKFGVVEIPTSVVSHLPPAIYQKGQNP